ncbi:MAG: NAD(+) synthase [Candidatus Izemoplasmatales bacterium]|nr:NAD(+) synthase [Acholeplasmataceae bacterium]
MIKNGFVKVSLISPKLEVGNPQFNVQEMLLALKDNPSAIAVFPELGIPGYTCSDLFFHKSLFDDIDAALHTFLNKNQYPGIVICGIPVSVEEMVLNCAIVIQKDHILGAIPKMYLPSTKEYYDRRWFKSGFDVIDQLKEVKLMGQIVPFGNLIFSCGDIRFGIEICEDMWATITPGNLMSVNGANVIINLSASNETLRKDSIRRNAVLEHSRKNCGIYLYCSAGASESTSETVFSGHNIVAENGILCAESNEFSLETEILYADLDILKNQHDRRNNSSFRDSLYKYRYVYREVPILLPESPDFEFTRKLDPEPFVPKTDCLNHFRKIAAIQEFALAKRLRHLGLKQLVIGVSGGLDSALALLVAVQTFDFLSLDRKGILAVTMPGLATSARTHKNANTLINSLNVTHQEIDLKNHILDHLELIGHDQTTEDTTYENTQARARTMVLMNLANKHHGLVLGTGDLSEIALGWSTYNGDQMSMYNVNAGIPKTVVRFMIQTHAEVDQELSLRDCLTDILNTPITPELKKAQSTEAVLGKYEINDFILYRFLVCGDTETRIRFLLQKAFPLKESEIIDYTKNFFQRFYSQQFKRQASPDSPKILDISLSPRSDFRMPADVKR